MLAKKLIFTCLTISLYALLGSSSALADKCADLEKKFRIACVDQKSACAGLESCQDQRRSCPQQIDEMASCEQFRNCMQEYHPAGTSENQMCNYEWSYSFIHGERKCLLRNPRYSTVEKDCPGYAKLDINERPFNDKDFNCEGQKERYKRLVQPCKVAYDNFKKECSQASKVTPPQTCVAANETITIEKVVVGNNDKNIFNGAIDPYGSISSFSDYSRHFISGNTGGVQSE